MFSKKINFRYALLGFFLAVFSFISYRHLVLGGGVAPAIDALCPFGGFEAMLTYVSGDGLVPRVMMSSLVLAFGVMVSALFFGRAFCGNMCPFGAVQEFLYRAIGRKTSVPARIDRYGRYVKYLVLLFAVVGAYAFGYLVYRQVDPFTGFFHFGKGVIWDYSESEFYSNALPFAVAIVVLLLGVFVERFFCRYLCPLGAGLGIFSKIGLFRVKKDSNCVSCGLCNMYCPQGIDISNGTAVDTAECIVCGRCADACGKGSLSFSVLGRRLGASVIGVLAIALVFGAVFGSQALGVWESIPQSISDDTGVIDADLIKGWMSIDDVSSDSGIPASEILSGVGLPSYVDTSVPMKEISETYGVTFETEDVREFVRNYEFSSFGVEEDVDCPWGVHDDPFPGQCGHYIDRDGNGICDESE